MPGISFICDFKNNFQNNCSAANKSLNLLMHNAQYKAKNLFVGEFCFLGFTGYDEYPIYTYENENYFICLEGRIYEDGDLDSRLNDLAERIFNRPDDTKDEVARWLLDTDGDFVAVIRHIHSNEVVIINDALARLPLYYFLQDGRIIISREIGFIASVLGGVQYDKMGIAQFLLFGYTCGIRTLYGNISYFLPGTMVRIRPDNVEIKMSSVNELNFEKMQDNSDTSEEDIESLAVSFQDACRSRYRRGKNNILALSGGLDSRAVAACFDGDETPVVCVTRLSADKREKLDAELAEKIAEQLNIKWELVRVAAPGGKELLSLLKMKSGMNSLDVGFNITFLEKIRDTYGRDTVYFTGDGGDRIKPHVKTRVILNSISDLADYIIRQNQLFSLQEVSDLTGIPAEQIAEEIRRVVMSYPETDLKQKYVHFMIYESAFKWVFEGEDRNRYYFWSVTPFYSIHFFMNAMRCPESSKWHHALYRRFLLKLSPQASSIDNADWGLPITSKVLEAHFFLKSLYSKLPVKLKTSLKALIRGTGPIRHNPRLISCLQEQIYGCLATSSYFDFPALQDLVNSTERYKKSAVYNLFTVTSVIEYFETGKSSLEHYFNSDFI